MRPHIYCHRTGYLICMGHQRAYINCSASALSLIPQFATQYSLIRSIRIFEMEKRFQCQYCDHGTNRRSSLETHVRCKHTFEEPFQCDYCEKRFKVQSNLARHIRSHTGYKPHVCDQCGAAFADKKNCDAHVEVEHHNRPRFECDHPGCNAKFSRLNNYEHHRRHSHVLI